MKNDPRDKKKVKIAGILVVVQVFGEKRNPSEKEKEIIKKEIKRGQIITRGKYSNRTKRSCLPPVYCFF